MNYAGLIYDDSPHYIDHLGPLCALLKWPLIVCEPAIAELARQYYPDLEVVEKSIWEVRLPTCIATCDNKALLQAAFPGQAVQTIWLPHGNSDKGINSSLFEALSGENGALVYGQKMFELVKIKKIRIGNFRWEYYLKHRDFYRQELPAGKKILYAPTWDDSGTFWRAFPHLAQRIPDDCHLLVKIHPNTVRKYGPELEIMKGKYERKNILFLPESPPIYPLLSQCDGYIGDMSSIGYDFLKFDKPLFFLNGKKDLPLHRCGDWIEPETFDLQKQGPFSPLRNALYDYTFDPPPDWNKVKEKIHALCRI